MNQMISFFFNYPATNEIYTYRHTLSLHDALPIWGASALSMVTQFQTDWYGEVTRWVDSVPKIAASESAANATVLGDWISAWSRSEEHTSELQSLMRISYAVFCLKKKNRYEFIQ